MKIVNKIIDFFSAVIEFLLFLLRIDCEFSLKKFLAYFFTGLVFYLAIYKDNISGELLIFLAALLGMREVSKKFNNNNHQDKEETKTVAGFKSTKKKDNEIG